MNFFVMTANSGKILGPIAKVLGVIMNAIYVFLYDTCHIHSGTIALAIIIFTLFIYLCLFPLTYRQQKFSTLTRKMQPELSAIQKKYKGRKDQASMAAQSEETQALYDKYGISPSGSCITALIQMPILVSLYRVFWNVPAYLPSVKNVFSDLVNGIIATDGYKDTITKIYEDANIRNLVVNLNGKGGTTDKNYIIDILYKLSENGWNMVAESFPKLTSEINSVESTLSHINYVFALNISDTPLNIVTTSFKSGAYGLMIAGVLIPLLSYGSQVLNLRLVPQASGGNDQMAQQMKTMNTFMPLMSLFFTFITPAGLGLYWIAGALIRIVQQVLLNKHFEKIDLDKIIEANKEKAAKKAEKRGIRTSQIMEAATMNTRKSFSSKAAIDPQKNEKLDKAAELRKNAHPDSMAAKAERVRLFNENKERTDE